MGLLDDAIREHLDLKRRRGADPAEIEKAEREALGPVRRDASATALSELEPPSARLNDAPGEIEDYEFVEGDGFADEDHAALPEIHEPVGAVDADPGIIAAADFNQPYLDEFDPTDPPLADEFDLPGEGPIAAMPPEPEHKPKRRHLFHFRSHDHDDVFDDQGPLPPAVPEDDPFADDDVRAAAPPAVEADEPRDLGPDETVGRARPIQRDAPDSGAPIPPTPPALQFTDTELGHTVEYDVEEAFAEEDKVGDGVGEDILEETPDFLADAPDHDRLWFEQKPPPDFDFDS